MEKKLWLSTSRNDLTPQEDEVVYNSSGQAKPVKTDEYYRRLHDENKQPEQLAKAVEQKQKNIEIDWSPVIGYEEIKTIIDATLNSSTKYKKKTHLLIGGAPKQSHESRGQG
jgi:hypothetical protein